MTPKQTKTRSRFAGVLLCIVWSGCTGCRRRLWRRRWLGEAKRRRRQASSPLGLKKVVTLVGPARRSKAGLASERRLFGQKSFCSRCRRRCRRRYKGEEREEEEEERENFLVAAAASPSS